MQSANVFTCYQRIEIINGESEGPAVAVRKQNQNVDLLRPADRKEKAVKQNDSENKNYFEEMNVFRK